MSGEDQDEIDEATAGVSSADAADQLFLHGLLTTVHRPMTDGEVRLQRALSAAFDPPVVERRPQARSRWTSTVMSLAAAFAAVAIAGWALLVPSNEVQAAESLKRVIAAVGEGAGRQYRVSLSMDGGEIRAGRLWLAGSGRVAAELPAILPSQRNRKIWVGFNGAEAWLVPAAPAAPVLAARGVDWLDRWMKELGVDEPFLNLESVLRRLQTGHKLRTFADPAGRKVIVAEGKAPSRVEIVVAKDGETIHRLRLTFRSPRRTFDVAIERESAAPDADVGVYEHAKHHDPGRRVVTLE